MIKALIGVFLILHGLVHLLYFGQSKRMFELKPGITWPDSSWALARLVGENSTRTLAGILCILAAAGFVIGSTGIFFNQSWWRPVIIASAALSIVLYILLWNGKMQNLDEQGAIAILINAAILVVVLFYDYRLPIG